MGRDAQGLANRRDAKRVGDMMDSGLIHAGSLPNSLAKSSANSPKLQAASSQLLLGAMDQEKLRPYIDIAERIKWHREQVVHLNQEEYARAIGHKRSALSLWEAGTHRLSLDGALSLRSKFGLSLDFMYEGIDDALPMTLRNAWRERP